MNALTHGGYSAQAKEELKKLRNYLRKEGSIL
jgi:hypothetical protein